MTTESSVPVKFSQIWGNGAATGNITTPIPATTSTAGRASLNLGFPPTNFQTGGIPPFGQDENGILNMLSAWAQWQAMGGPIVYDSTFQTAIGGYPNGAIIASASTAGKFYLSTVDSNTTNPDASGAGWRVLTFGFANRLTITATQNWTVPAGIFLVRFFATGGGGGGSNSAGTTPGANYSSGGGGGAGGTAIGIYSVTPGASIAITIGAGGSGNGVSGGTTTVTGFCSATGGGGAQFQSATSSAGGAPGVGSGGQTNLYGGWGQDGQNGSFVNAGAMGGASFWGGGARGGLPNGATSLNYGGGGGGSYGSGTGGAGGGGVGVIEY